MRVNLSFGSFVFAVVAGLLVSPRVYGIPRQGSPARAQEQIDRLFQQAQADVAKGNYDAAADKYKEALALEPQSPQALSNLGVCLYMGGHTREAVEPLCSALRVDPGRLPANLILGMAYVKLGEFDKALSPLQRVLRQDGKNRDAWLALASAYLGLHQYDKAGEAYARELGVYPRDSDAWYGVGLSFERVAEETARKLAEVAKDSSYYQRLLGEYLTEEETGIEAEEALRRALASSGEGGEGLHAALGFALLRLEEPSRALDEFRAELRLNPGNLDGRLGLAAVEMDQGHLAEGFDNLCKIAQTDKSYLRSHTSFFVTFIGQDTESEINDRPGFVRPPAGCQDAVALIKSEFSSPGSAFDPEPAIGPLGSVPAGLASPDSLLIARALQESRAGQYEGCARDLQEARISGSEDRLRLARCACLSGRYLVSLEASQKALSEDSQNLEAYYWQAESARRLAGAGFRRAMSLNPNSWQGQLLLGDIYRQRKDWEAAISHYNMAAQLKPSSAAASLGLATLCWENGWFDRAETALHKVLELDPENAQANLELGDIYVRAHRFDEALPLLQKALAHDTHHSLLIHADLGKSYAGMGEVDRAVAELTQATPLDTSGEIHYQLYRLYQTQGQPGLAQEALTESERLRRQDAQDRQRRLARATELGKSGQPSKH